MGKTCTLCNEDKELDQFGKNKMMKDGHINQCKTCRSAYIKKYQEDNKEKLSARSKAYYETNSEHIKERVRTHWNENADEINEKRRHRYDNESDYKEKRLAEVRKSNAKLRPERRKKRRETDEAWRLEQVCRTRLWNALKGVASKSARTMELVGCTGEQLVKYLETTKVPGKDYTDAHVDHIKPCSAFDLTDPEEQKKCFHYSNLQYLPAIENMKKGCSY
jgi:hypothetical protein